MKAFIFNFIFLFFVILFFPVCANEYPLAEQVTSDQAIKLSEAKYEVLRERYLGLKEDLDEQQQAIHLLLEKLAGRQSAVTYTDWVAITLACVGVLVTVLGVLIAVLSFWGYKNIIREARNSAKSISNNTSSKIAKEQVESCINRIAKDELVKLIDAGELRPHLEAAVDMIYRNDGSLVAKDNGFGKFPEVDQEEGRE